MCLSLYDEVTNVLRVSVLSHDWYQYDSLILSEQTWAHPRQHLQQLLWCQGLWRGADVTKECLETNFQLSSTLLCKLRVHYTNGFDNVESVYFFYNNPVLLGPTATRRVVLQTFLATCRKVAAAIYVLQKAFFISSWYSKDEYILN
jgi:hypothetical protein